MTAGQVERHISMQSEPVSNVERHTVTEPSAENRDLPDSLEDNGAPAPLTETSGGSTQAIPSDDGRPATSGPATDMPQEEASTGGFETLLGKLVIDSGLATIDEVEACNTQLMESSSGDAPRTLTDVLIERDYLTEHQLERLRSEFEAKKSSQRIPGYRIKRKLGSGAMATVFLAKQLSLDRLVAVKVLPKKFSDNTKFIERFYKEGRAAAQLNHPNIVSAYDVGKAGDHHYFVMEYVDGVTVHERIKRRRFAEREAIAIVKQIARAMQHAHERGFIHRDIKPKNIMITSGGVAKLADLGLARAIADEEAAKAEMGRAYGTPYYISPEQIRGELKIGPAADIYGLGATFYHMVTARVPFEGKNPSTVMHKHLKHDLIPPDHINPQLSAGCAQVIEMMLAKDPVDRYRDVGELLEDLDLIAQGEAPRYARQVLDHTHLASALTDEVAAPPMSRALEHRESSIFDSPAFTVILVILAFSVLVNIILLVLALSAK